MAKKLTRKFRNPEPNIEHTDDFIDLWSFRSDNKKIELDDNVKIKTTNLSNISNLYNVIGDGITTWWQPVSSNKSGYVPSSSNNSVILSINNQGNAEWINPEYSKLTSISTNIRYIRPNDLSSEQFNSLLSERGQDTNDYILNLNNFLCNVTISVEHTNTSTPLIVTTNE